MESTANKIYEIEDSAIMSDGMKGPIEEDFVEENKQGKALLFLTSLQKTKTSTETSSTTRMASSLRSQRAVSRWR